MVAPVYSPYTSYYSPTPAWQQPARQPAHWYRQSVVPPQPYGYARPYPATPMPAYPPYVPPMPSADRFLPLPPPKPQFYEVSGAPGLKAKDTVVGTGPTAEKGQRVKVHYTGTLHPSGEKFDSSLDRGKPFTFPLGAGMVIKGWDKGVAGMKVGGKRTLIIPSELGYGKRGSPPKIPSNATLKFDVELLGIES